ncbi:hypothetical protein ACQ7BN_11705, partial [Streptococcus suis]
DSTDKTKYRWADRWAKIEVGGRNYVLDSDVLGLTSTVKDFRFSFESDLNILRGKSVIVSVYIDANNFTSGRIGFEPSVTFRDGTRSYANLWYNKPNTVFKGRIWTIWKIPDKEIASFGQRGFYNQTSGGTASGGRPKLEIGTAPTDWTPAPEDIQAGIDSKADQALTQEQLNALNERANLLKTELDAKVAIDAVNELIGEYRRMLDVESANVRENQEALVEAAKRVAAIELNLGQFAERVEFLDSYMTRSNEGLIIGKNDGSALIRVSENRISMLSAGKEVMYISQGVIHIDNGIFTK